MLLEKNRNKEFDSIKDPSVFRKAVQDAIRNVVDDQHMRLFYFGLREVSTENTGSDNEISALKSEYEKRKEMNFGIPEVKVMENNIGYLKITKFTSPALFGPVVRASLAFLKNVDGLIFDLRSRGGGNSDAVVLLLSYLLPPETPVFYWEDRYGNILERNWTYPYVDGSPFTAIPMVVLTSTKTFSGSEAFAYILKHHKMATIIGEVTRGGAHTYQEIPLSGKYDYLFLLPHERVLSTKTQQNWEGTGVMPHISVAAEDALDKAQKWMINALKID